MKKLIVAILAICFLASTCYAAEYYINMPVTLDNELTAQNGVWALGKSETRIKHVGGDKKYRIRGFIFLWTSLQRMVNDQKHEVACTYEYPFNKTLQISIEEREQKILVAILKDNDVTCSGSINGSVDFTQGTGAIVPGTN